MQCTFPLTSHWVWTKVCANSWKKSGKKKLWTNTRLQLRLQWETDVWHVDKPVSESETRKNLSIFWSSVERSQEKVVSSRLLPNARISDISKRFEPYSDTWVWSHAIKDFVKVWQVFNGKTSGIQEFFWIFCRWCESDSGCKVTTSLSKSRVLNITIFMKMVFL